MRSLNAALVPFLLCCSSIALAQPVDVNLPAPPVVALPPPQVVAVPCLGPGHDKACLAQVLEMDPRYRSARARRNGGIVLASVGSGVGAVAMLVAWTSYMSRDVGDIFCTTCHNDYTGEKIAAIAGASLLVVSLAVGIPTIVSGSREMRFVRNQYLLQMPVPAVSVGPHQTTVGAAWRF